MGNVGSRRAKDYGSPVLRVAVRDFSMVAGWMKAACYDCGMSYGDPAWVECVVPDHVWWRISPTGHEGGLLCIGCMAKRLAEQRIVTEVLLTAGPMVTELDPKSRLTFRIEPVTVPEGE